MKQCIMHVHTRGIFLWSHAFSNFASAEHEEALWQQVIRLLVLYSKIASETISEGLRPLVACPNPPTPQWQCANVTPTFHWTTYLVAMPLLLAYHGKVYLHSLSLWPHVYSYSIIVLIPRWELHQVARRMTALRSAYYNSGA